MMDRIQEKIRELEEQIHSTYRNYSRIDDICITNAVPLDQRRNQFRQFAKRFLIERQHITDETHFLIFDNFGSGVARSELNYLIHELNQNSQTTNIPEVTLANIREQVEVMHNNGHTPNVIFMPIEYYHTIHEWNMQPFQEGLIDRNLGDSLVVNRNAILKVIFSNKYVPFENVIITSRENNLWEYRADERTDSRLTAKMDWELEDPINAILLVKTVFNYQVHNELGNHVLIPEIIPNND